MCKPHSMQQRLQIPRLHRSAALRLPVAALPGRGSVLSEVKLRHLVVLLLPGLAVLLLPAVPLRQVALLLPAARPPVVPLRLPAVASERVLGAQLHRLQTSAQWPAL
jgi:hypothetical protein